MADALAANKPFMLDLRDAEVLHRARRAARRSTSSSRSPRPTRTMTFINVEPYQLKVDDGSLQPVLDATDNSRRSAVDATTAFMLSRSRGSSRSTGRRSCSGSYELVITPAELDAAIKAVEAG